VTAGGGERRAAPLGRREQRGLVRRRTGGRGGGARRGVLAADAPRRRPAGECCRGVTEARDADGVAASAGQVATSMLFKNDTI
jgi:hypothetical protein